MHSSNVRCHHIANVDAFIVNDAIIALKDMSMHTADPPAGFTLIELLVVISITALLAAILFPVFACAREKARQNTCISHQRQLSAGVLMYCQDHDDTLPGSANVWRDVNVDSGILKCPTAGNALPVAYLYNLALDGIALGAVKAPDGTNDLSLVWMTVDGEAGSAENRHNGKYVVSYLDGHVTSTTFIGAGTEGGVPAGNVWVWGYNAHGGVGEFTLRVTE